MTDCYAVIGNPVAHSKSPDIHAAFARQTTQDIRYERVLAPLDRFADTVARLRAEGFKGCNVTVPFKQEAWMLCGARLSARARAAEAVNTLCFDADGTRGDNTDGIGLIRDIQQNLGRTIAAKRVLLMGAGGAARGALLPLLQEQPEAIVVVNRSSDKAVALAHQTMAELPGATTRGITLQGCAYANLAGMHFDLIINATSSGLHNELPPLPDAIFTPGALAYDMMYGRETPFMAFARRQGAQVADGLGMLVEQAAEAFYLWRGIRPKTAPVIASLRT